MGKLVQGIVHGAQCVTIDGNFDDALRLVRRAQDSGAPVAVVNSINPYRIEGQKTAAFEIVEELGDAPDVHFLPVGNAGNISAYWKGYGEFRGLGRSSKLPRMVGFQAAGAAPLFHGQVVEQPETVASAIRIGNPASWEMAAAAVRESGGTVDIVTDEQILFAQRWLAANEGIFVEPASAASVAGLLKCRQQGEPQAEVCGPCPMRRFPDDGVIVCTVTGHGLKDTETILKNSAPLSAPIQATWEAISALIS